MEERTGYQIERELAAFGPVPLSMPVVGWLFSTITRQLGEIPGFHLPPSDHVLA
jgi:hypothetical protein